MTDVNVFNVDFDKEPTDERLLDVKHKFDTLVVESVQHWRDRGALRPSDSRSFAITVKVLRGEDALSQVRQLPLDDPDALFDFASMQDIDGQGKRYGRNALAKVRPVVRTGVDSLELSKDMFADVIDGSRDSDKVLAWGEFPWAGGVMLNNHKPGKSKIIVLAGVSGFDADEDDWLARAFGDFVRLKLEMAEVVTESESGVEPAIAVPQQG